MHVVSAIEAELVSPQQESGLGRDYEARTDAWSRCMATQGVSGLTNPAEIYDLVFAEWRRNPNTDLAEQLEANISHADLNCDDPSLDNDLETLAEELLRADPNLADLVNQVVGH